MKKKKTSMPDLPRHSFLFLLPNFLHSLTQHNINVPLYTYPLAHTNPIGSHSQEPKCGKERGKTPSGNDHC